MDHRFKSVLFEAVCEAVQQDRVFSVRGEGSTCVTSRNLVSQVRSRALALLSSL